MTVVRMCQPICNHCQRYKFNGDEDGAYVNDGRCEHPEHPKAAEPHDSCPDFACSVCAPPRAAA
jgi:hypothetical protein